MHRDEQSRAVEVGTTAELAEARWFSKDELIAIAPNPREAGLVSLPPELAITRVLLDDYLGGV